MKAELQAATEAMHATGQRLNINPRNAHERIAR